MKIFLSPHNDDETIFGAFSIMRERLLVVIVFDGYVQGSRGAAVTHEQRRRESRDAMIALGAPCPRFAGLRDDRDYTPQDVAFRLRACVDIDETFDAMYSPIYDDDGHAQHNLVSRAAGLLVATSHVRYSTYTRGGGRQRTDREVTPADGGMIARKHRALACYGSQLSMDPRLGCWPWFMDSMREYIA